jgi:DNA-binding transcriptional LysR family regulator
MQARSPKSRPPPRGAAGRRLPSWENVQAFLHVVEHGSFRAAALKLGISINRLRHRVAKLERQLGATLLTRHVDGVRATAEGEQVLAAARNMQRAYFELMRANEIAHPSAVREVKLAAAEGLGTLWLAPRLAAFRLANPGLLVDLRCVMQPVDILRLEADAAVQLTKPTAPEIEARKLGRVHLIPYAASAYIEAHGAPTGIETLARHRLVFQTGEEGAIQQIEALFGTHAQASAAWVRTNSSSAHALAIGSGAGIGWLPSYASAITTGLVALELDARCSLEIWVACHPDVARIPRVRHVMDWLIGCFDPAQFPWFRDEFVHPRHFAELYRGEPLFNLSGHFAEDEVPFVNFPALLATDPPQLPGVSR